MSSDAWRMTIRSPQPLRNSAPAINASLTMSVDLQGPYDKRGHTMIADSNSTIAWHRVQLKKNRESSFPQSKDVKLDVRDRHVTMLGRDGAVVTCLWTQTQTFNGQPDSASGRMTLVFKRVGTEWKAVHLHTSPDKPDPSRVPQSEQSPPDNTFRN